MATKKKSSGFSAPAIGKVYPKGTKFKTNRDGTISPAKPRKSSKKK